MADGIAAAKHWATAHAVDPRSVYVNRAHDRAILDALVSNTVTLLQGSRMSGKSSLLSRTRMRLGDLGARERRLMDLALPDGLTADSTVVAYCDLTAMYADTAADLARGIVEILESRAGVPRAARADLRAARGPEQVLREGLERLQSALESEGRQLDQAIVMIDEADAFEHYDWVDEFFEAIARIRACSHETGAIGKMRLVLASVRPIRYLVRDPSSEAHVVPDRSLWLDDFSSDDTSIKELAEGFPPAMTEHALGLAGKAIEYTGGYPQACTWLCSQMARHAFTADPRSGDLEARVAALVDHVRADVDFPVFLSYPSDFLLGYSLRKRGIVDDDPGTSVIDALWNYRQLLAGHEMGFSSTEPAIALLCWAGLAQRDTRGALTVRGKLLRRHYTSNWARDLSRQLSEHAVSLRRQGARPGGLKKVIVFTTGGTIGMVEDESGVVQAETAGSAYADAQAVATVQFERLCSRDSANLVPDDWEKIAQSVADVIEQSDVAGVVVAHGTDTLAYTASAVGFALGRNLSKPVVFTGSQAPVTVRYADASVNVARACKLAADEQIAEVTICFGDTVLRACQAQKRDDRRFDGFESPFGPPLAIITEEIYYNRQAMRSTADRSKDPLVVRRTFDTRILTITQVPGLRPELLLPVLERANQGGVSGIVIQSLGAGNLPTRNEYSLVDFIERAMGVGVPVVVGSLYPVRARNAEIYQPSMLAFEKGAIKAFNMTLPAIVTKLAWILGQHRQEDDASDAIEYVRRWMPADQIGEVIDEFSDPIMSGEETP